MKTSDPVISYTQSEHGQSSNPFAPVDLDQVLSDLAVSRREIAEGNGTDAREALLEIGRENGYL